MFGLGGKRKLGRGEEAADRGLTNYDSGHSIDITTDGNKIVITLLMTGVLGGAITYYYQHRVHRKQRLRTC